MAKFSMVSKFVSNIANKQVLKTTGKTVSKIQQMANNYIKGGNIKRGGKLRSLAEIIGFPGSNIRGNEKKKLLGVFKLKEKSKKMVLKTKHKLSKFEISRKISEGLKKSLKFKNRKFNKKRRY